jgi:uncharacterized OB-fold protein
MYIPSTCKPENASLFALADDGASVSLLYAKCVSCGGLTFPSNAPGCATCGDPLDEAEQVARPGAGTLREAVTVHIPLAPDMKVPVTIGLVELVEGVCEQVVLDVPVDAIPAPGTVVCAVASTSGDASTYACRFVPAEGAAA